MRNLKKFLALVLALMMVVSVMVTVNAASYDDDASIDYDEAVAVMTAVGVFEGDGTGNFLPDQPLTRDVAAKIITYMILGKDAANQLKTPTAPFTDVPVDNWAAGPIAYCANANIVAGGGDGKFYPDTTVNGYQFAKMLLGVLGYQTDIELFTGAGWEINVAAIALKDAKLTAGSDITLSSTLTREQAAQMAFNAINANTVSYSGGTNVTLSDGTTIVVDATRTAGATYRSSAYPYLHYANAVTSLSDLGADAVATSDAYGRPVASQWYTGTNATKVSVYQGTSAPLMTYTTATKAPETDLKNAQGIDSVRAVINGVTQTDTLSNAASISALTGNGNTVEVFGTKNAAGVITVTNVTAIEPTLAKVTNVTKSTVTLNTVRPDTNVAASLTVKAEDDTNGNEDYFDTLAAVGKDGYIALVLGGTTANYNVIKDTAPVTKVTGKLTKIDGSTKYTIGGVEYGVAGGKKTTFTEAPNVSATTDVVAIVDANGNILDFVKGETVSTTVNSMFVVTDYDTTNAYGDNINNFQGVLPDGSVVTGVYEGTKPNANTAYTYTVAPATGKYTFTEKNTTTVSDEGPVKITGSGNSTVNVTEKSRDITVCPDGSTTAKVYFASSVTFVYVTGAKDSLKVDKKDGLQNIALTSEGIDYAVLAKDSAGNFRVTTVFVVSNSNATTTPVDQLIYVKSNTTANGTTLGTDGKTVVSEYTVYVNGEKTTITTSATELSGKNGWYTAKVNSTTGAYTLTQTSDNVVLEKTGAATIDLVDGTYLMTASEFTQYDATNAIVVDLSDDAKTDGEVNSIGGLYAIKSHDDLKISVAYDTTAKTVSLIYVIDQGTVAED